MLILLSLFFFNFHLFLHFCPWLPLFVGDPIQFRPLQKISLWLDVQFSQRRFCSIVFGTRESVAVLMRKSEEINESVGLCQYPAVSLSSHYKYKYSAASSSIQQLPCLSRGGSCWRWNHSTWYFPFFFLSVPPMQMKRYYHYIYLVFFFKLPNWDITILHHKKMHPLYSCRQLETRIQPPWPGPPGDYDITGRNDCEDHDDNDK